MMMMWYRGILQGCGRIDMDEKVNGAVETCFGIFIGVE
jgi:hypothetical protein